ncbi:MAG: hypothetical protein K9N47_21020 [Prosthecobacter sp.]|uniref:hypothetical protein n=1 Tax=Prosthecobacter sp. TaxID=1965333 RepID=UPI0026242111|nr:hypothetical protein [Prosthecobacter sp.]MCF7788618.1 hypothetical protein [Prosthecobacter sp.]
MSWISITSDDLNDTKLAPLMSALSTAALAEGQADPLPGYITTACNHIRRKVAACRTNRVDADATKIPESLKEIACRMVVRAAKDRLEYALTEDERKQWDKDDRELDAIANCSMPVEISDDSEEPTVQSTQPGPTIKARRKRFGCDQQDGA